MANFQEYDIWLQDRSHPQSVQQVAPHPGTSACKTKLFMMSVTCNNRWRHTLVLQPVNKNVYDECNM